MKQMCVKRLKKIEKVIPVRLESEEQAEKSFEEFGHLFSIYGAIYQNAYPKSSVTPRKSA